MLWRDANHAVVDRKGAGGSMHSECRMGNFDDFLRLFATNTVCALAFSCMAMSGRNLEGF